MANVKPLVAGPAQFQQLQTGDTLLAPAVNRGNGFVSWTGEATVTPSTSVAFVDNTGALLSPTKTYKVAACNIDSSAQRGAVVLFVGNGASFTRQVVYEESIYSSNVKLYLNAGVPTVSVYGGSGSYRIVYLIEEIPNFGTALSELAILQRITDAPSDGTTYVRKDGVWVAAAASHTHVIGDVTGLQSALDSKAGSATTLAGYGITDAVATSGTQTVAGDKTFTGALADSAGHVRDLAINTQNATYTLALADRGKCVLKNNTAAYTWTIPPNSSVAYPIGTMITLRNANATGAVTIARGSGVALRKAGSGTNANATLAVWGMATLLKEGTDSWVISGAGVS